MVAAELTILDRFFDLLSTKPEAREILDFKANQEEEDRYAYLTRRDSLQQITVDEKIELGLILKAKHYASIAKIKAMVELGKIPDHE